MLSFRLILVMSLCSLLVSPISQSAELQIIKATWAPDGKRTADVTHIVSGLVKDNRLDWKVDPAAFGTELAKVNKQGGRLSITYKLGDVTRTSAFKRGDAIWLSLVSKDQVELLDSVAELRKTHPEGLLILKAEYRVGREFVDVTDLLQSLVRGDSLTVPVCNEAFGDPDPKSGGKWLKVVYHNGKELKSVDVRESDTLQIGDQVRPIIARKGGVVDLQEELNGLRVKQPKGLIVLAARFGFADWVDLTDIAKNLVIDDSLTIPVNSEALGAGRGAAGNLEIYYAVDDKVKFTKQPVDTTLQIGEKLTAMLGQKGELISLPKRAAELRKTYPTGLLVIDAQYGKYDVTEAARELVSGDSLTLTPAYMLDVPQHWHIGPIRIVYQQGTEFFSVTKAQEETVQIGPRRTAIPKRSEYGMFNLDRLVAKRQKEHRGGLLVVDAKFGRAWKWMDVTERVQDKVKGDVLDIVPSTEEWGSAGPDGTNFLILTYLDGKRCVTVSTFQGMRLKIDKNTVALVDDGGLPLNNDAKLAVLRKRYGDGLLILEALFGYNDGILDNREWLQGQVKDNRIVSKIGEGWPVVSAGGNNKLTLTYWDGEEIKTLNQDQGMVLDIRGRVNVALRGMKEPPSHAAVGKSLTHLFGVAGNFRLTSGPKGATLSTTGQLKWTPTADQIGVQQFSYTVIVGGQSIARVSSIEVVSAEVAKQVGGDAGKLSQLMSLELGEGTATYTRGLDGKSALVLREGQLLVLNADGTTVDKGFDLPQTFTRIREREEYYIAVTQEPSAMLILDKETLKPIRTIKLLYKATTDLALHPNLPFTYIATDQPVEGEARYRVVVVDETNGEIREPENVVGTFLAVSPDGRHLYTGYKDLYRRGTRLFMNPDGRIWDSPQYGNIDILMIYDIDRGTKLALRKYKDNAGANGAGLAVSPDGKRLSYLSFSGYPAGSGAIPAWNPTDLEKKPVGYPCKGRTSATKMTYHPVLPMVLVPTETGCILFNRETGDEEKDRVKLPESVDGAKVEDAQFSPDGLSVVLQVRHAGTAYLKKLPLRLNSEEIKSISRGVPAMAPVPPKPEPSRSTTNEPRA